MRRASRQAVEAFFGQTLVGEFELIDFLGAGSHADVFLARQRSVQGRRVAVKLLSYLYLSLPEADGRRAAVAMAREAELLGALHSPCFVTIYSTGVAPDRRPFIAMELAEGPTLSQFVASRPPYGEVVVALRQWAEGLAELHARGWVHRDVTPANCVVGESILHSVRVLTYDLGTATALTERPDRFTVGWDKERPPGTPAYMAPEQAQGAPVDGRADQFALAAIAYEWLTGARPIVNDAGRVASALDYLRGDGALPHRPLSALRPDLPPQVGEVVERALARDPQRRYPDIRQFVDDLGLTLAGAEPTRSSASVWGWLRGRLRR